MIPEENDTPLGNQQCELILLLIGEVLELEAFDLSADVCGQISDLSSGREEGLLLLVGPSARVVVHTLLAPDLVYVIKVERP